MKLVQSDNQITITKGGTSQIVSGIAFVVGGIIVAALPFTSITLSSGHKLPSYISLVGLVFIAIGILSFVFARKEVTTIQKGGNTTVTITRVIGQKSAQQSFPTSSISLVRLVTYSNNANPNNIGSDMNNLAQSNNRQSVLSLELNNNDVVQLGVASSSANLSIGGMNVNSIVSHAPLHKEAETLSNFLGVPLDAQDSTSVQGAFGAITDAFNTSRQGQAQSTFTQNSSPAPSTQQQQPIQNQFTPPVQNYNQPPQPQEDQNPTNQSNPPTTSQL